MPLFQRRRLIGATFGATFAASISPMHAQTPSTAGPLDTVLRERLRHEGVALAAAQVDADGLRFSFAGPGAQPDARFEYGSLTKTFTALLLAEMVGRGELTLGQPVEALLGGAKLRDSAGTPITLLDLATHRSGLPRLPDNLRPRDGRDPYADYDAARLMTFVDSFKPEVPRDSRWVYSNLGFGLLGHVLALRAGKPFDALLRERVLAPLKLDEIEVALPGRTVARLLAGHDADRRPVPPWRFDALAGAGALVGSVASLARYAQAALGLIGHPLQPAFELALRRHADGGVPHNPMALGWILAPLGARQVAVHDGGTFGFASSVVIDRTARRAGIVLANSVGSVNDLALHALDAALPLRDIAAEKRKLQREPATIDAAWLAPLAGVYAIDPRFKVSVRVRDARLFAQATGQGEFELFALDSRRFFARVTPLEIQFEGDAGIPAAFILHQGGAQQRFIRE